MTRFQTGPNRGELIERCPDGSINNCAAKFGEDPASCQMCGGRCPDQQDTPRSHMPKSKPVFDTTDVDPIDYLRECVRIEPVALQEEYVRLPADYAYWNERYRQKLEVHLLAEAERKRVYAAQLLLASERVNNSTGKPVTVDQAKAIAETAEEYQDVVGDAITAEADMIEARGVLEAIRTKRDMIIQMGATVRQELQHDPAVRDRARNQRRDD